MNDNRITSILDLLEESYPNAHIMLTYNTPWQLLVAVILSAQCTDIMVNKVTKSLFITYPTIEDVARAKQEVFEEAIKPTGFYRNKAKHCIGAAQLIIKRWGGKIPKTLSELITIPGVARKTANVVQSNIYHIYEGIAVDTHVLRLSKRLHLVSQNAYDNPIKTENELMALLPHSTWGKITYRLIDHGRAVCTAKNPQCGSCILRNLCPSAFLVSKKQT